MKTYIQFLAIILIAISCTKKYKQCEFVQSDKQMAIYNDVLIEIVEHHTSGRYLGKDIDLLNDRIFNNQIDSTGYEQDLISLQNKLYGNTDKFHSIYIVDTFNEKVNKLFGLHNIQKFKMEKYINVDTDTTYNKISNNPQMLFDSINVIQYNLNPKQFHTCTFNVKSINDFDESDFNKEIGVLLFTKVFLNKSMDEGVFYYIFKCGNQCAKGSLCYVKKVGNHWKIVNNKILWVS